jgi:HlyD family secretion protein
MPIRRIQQDSSKVPRLTARPEIVALAVVLSLALGALLFFFSGTRVVAVQATRGKATEAVYATGTVEAENRMILKAKTSGRVAELFVREGDRVAKNTLLARIDAPEVHAELKRGKAALTAAAAAAAADSPQVAALKSEAATIQAELAQARSEHERMKKLFQEDAISKSELDRSTAHVRALQGTLSANLAQQRAMRTNLRANATGSAAQVEILQSRAADAEIRAPIDGIVLTRSIDVGHDVMPGQALFTFGSPVLIVDAMVDEADVGRIRTTKRPVRVEPEGALPTPEQTLGGAGQDPPSTAAVRFYAFRDEVFHGEVAEILADADRDRKTFHLKVRLLAPPEGLRSGMSAEMNIITRERQNVVVVPTEAESGGFVWVIDGSKAMRREVEVGVRDLSKVEVVSGINEGDVVVVEGHDKLEDGARVRVTYRPEPPRAQVRSRPEVPDGRGKQQVARRVN